jgi:hypothetical protein
VLARARATVAGEEIPPAPPAPLSQPVAMPFTRAGRVVRIALAASIALIAGAVGALAALHGWTTGAPEIVTPRSAPRAPGALIAPADSPSDEALPPDVEPAAPSPRPRQAHLSAKRDPFSAELALLQRAHAAYTRGDFSAALAVVAEHARRFPTGHLAEQREALRVRSLAGAGRADEAHRAAAAFAVRFPRSVLLPRVEEGTGSSER